MKFTGYFLRNRERSDRRWIRFEWIEQVIRNPDKRVVQADGRIRLWGTIEEAGGKALRVILLEDEETVHNAFFDKQFKEDEP